MGSKQRVGGWLFAGTELNQEAFRRMDASVAISIQTRLVYDVIDQFNGPLETAIFNSLREA